MGRVCDFLTRESIMFQWNAKRIEGKTVSVYLEFARKSFLRAGAYRFEVWTRLFANLTYFLMWGSIWYALYQSTDGVNGESSFRQVLTYVALSQMIQTLHAAGTPIYEIQHKVRKGDIALELMRPYDFPLRSLFGDLGNIGFYLITAVLPVYSILFVFLHDQLPFAPGELHRWGWFLLAFVLSYLVRYAIDLCFGLLTFWLIETGGIGEIVYFALQLLSGQVIPLWFFPEWLLTVAAWLPFQAIYYIPNAILLGRIPDGQLLNVIGVQVFWVVFMLSLLRITWHQAVKRVIIQGG
mgnify:CR=1 FL=1